MAESSKPITRRAALQALAALAGGAGLPVTVAAAPPASATEKAPPQRACQAAAWPLWQDFKRVFLSEGGRVIDRGNERQQTVSEGQAYALFFALIANDRPAFDLILKWTEDNLAEGDLTARLPAWQWGRRDDGSWGVLDANPASDADLWIAYTLAEASVVWKERRLLALATLIGNRVLREETAELPGLGWTLLPGPKGFALDGGRWRLNPSYVPLPVMRRFAALYPESRWTDLVRTSLRLLHESAPKGFAPDWALYAAGKGFLPDTGGPDGTRGGYNAIRVYLWAAMGAPDDPETRPLLQRFAPMARLVAKNGLPPETVEADSGTAKGNGPFGFSAALVPFLEAAGETAAAREQLLRVEARSGQGAPAYYSQVLTLFALGWRDGRYRFSRDGALQLPWHPACGATSVPSSR